MASTPFRNVFRPTLPAVEEDIKQTLWANVRQLMIERWGKENINRLARESKPKIGLASAQRVKQADTSVGIDIVEAIAKGFGVAPFSLLIPKRNKFLYDLTKDKSFLSVARAYTVTDERGREILLLNAELLMSKSERGGREKSSTD